MVKINSLFVIALALVAVNPAFTMPLDKRAPQTNSFSVDPVSGTETLSGTETGGKPNGSGSGTLTISDIDTIKCRGAANTPDGANIPDGAYTCTFTPVKGNAMTSACSFDPNMNPPSASCSVTFIVGDEQILECTVAGNPKNPTIDPKISGCTLNGKPIVPPSTGSTGSSTGSTTGLTSALSGAQSGVKNNANSVSGIPSNAANADKVTGTTTKSNASSSPSTISRR